MTHLLRTIGCLLSLVALLSLSCGEKKSAQGKTAIQDTTTEQAPVTDSVTIALEGKDSVSVFELLRASHKVNYWSTAVGVFVKGIDSVDNGPRSFWIYSVNDATPNVASDKWLTKTGDRVVWHYRRLNQQDSGGSGGGR